MLLCAVCEFGVVAGRERNDFFFVVKKGVYFTFRHLARATQTRDHWDTATTREKWRRVQMNANGILLFTFFFSKKEKKNS